MMNRRDFLARAGMAVAALAIVRKLPSFQAPVPRIYGDGIHDDTAGIQAAIDRAQTSFSLHGGMYRVTDAIYVPHGKSFGIYGNRILMASGRTPHVIAHGPGIIKATGNHFIRV